jgi:hypothetical protein
VQLFRHHFAEVYHDYFLLSLRATP